MHPRQILGTAVCLFALMHGAPARLRAQSAAEPMGWFAGHTDVGAVLHAGSAEYDAARRTYTVSGSGENMWFAADAFQFVWKKVSGDVTLTADISFIGTGGEAHRKAVLMIRQSLDADSAYADAARHGDGLTSLQARHEKGAITSEIQSAVKAPARVRIAKRGDYFYIWVAEAGGELRFSGGSMRVPMHDPFYVGLGVCSHNKDAVEKAVFSNVELSTAAPSGTPVLYSTLETVPVSGDRRVVYVTPGRIARAEWTADGTALIFERDGRRERMPLAGGRPEIVSGSLPTLPDSSEAAPAPSGDLQNCCAHRSPDGRQVAFLSFAGAGTAFPEDQDVMLRLMSLADQKIRVLAELMGGRGTLDTQPWSPDSRRLGFISYQRMVP